MTIFNKKLFAVSLTIIALSVGMIIMTFKNMILTATSDFNFAPPFIMMMGLAQILVCIYGLFQAFRPSAK